MSDFINIIINRRWEISGTLISIAIGAYLVGLNNRRNRFASASEKFRNIILVELKDIYPHPVNWPNNTTDINPFLKSKFTTLQAAVEEFRMSLPRYKRKSFKEVWFRYYCSTGRKVDKDCQVYDHYMPFITTSIIDGKEVTVDTTKTYKEMFKHNVDSLLKFAKKT